MVNTHQLTTPTASTTRSKEANSKINLDVNHLTKNMTDHGIKIAGSRNNVKETNYLSRIRKPREPRRALGGTAFQPAESTR